MDVKKKLYIAVLLLLVVIIIAVFGYLITVDTFYMTVITVSSVGFGLILPFSIEVELFTIFLLFLSVFYADTCLKYSLKILQ
jgi:voltage-gated potassium channel